MRYVTPLREGGSLPAIIEADDDGLYVLKFRGAGQGVKALIAELLAHPGLVVRAQVENQQPPARLQNADRFTQRRLLVDHSAMVQHIEGRDQIKRSRRERQLQHRSAHNLSRQAALSKLICGIMTKPLTGV